MDSKKGMDLSKDKPRRVEFISFVLDELVMRGTHCDSIHIQKSCYVAQKFLGISLGYEFVPDSHGPYSEALSNDIHDARRKAVLEFRSSYFLTNHVKEYVEGNRDKYEFIDQVKFIGEWFKRKNGTELEKLTATHIVINELEPKLTEDKQIKIILDWKPHFTKEEIKEAIQQLNEKQQEADQLLQHIAAKKEQH